MYTNTIQGMLDALHTLNLGYTALHVGDGGENEEEGVGQEGVGQQQGGGPPGPPLGEVVLVPNNQQDMDVFLNMVQLAQVLLPLCGAARFRYGDGYGGGGGGVCVGCMVCCVW